MDIRWRVATAPLLLVGIAATEAAGEVSENDLTETRAVRMPIAYLATQPVTVRAGPEARRVGLVAVSQNSQSQDRLRHFATESRSNRAISERLSGRTASTMTPGAFVIAAEAEHCRDFERTGTMDGQTIRYRGVVCRQPDGQWRVKTEQKVPPPRSGHTQGVPNRAQVAEVQRLLTELGFDPGPADGVPGPKTRESIKAYQRRQGLPEDGQISESLIENLKSEHWRSTGAAGRQKSAEAQPITTPWTQPGSDSASASEGDLFQSPVAPGERRIVRAGYGRFFQPIRKLVTEGRFNEAFTLYDKLIAEIGKCGSATEACEPTASQQLSNATTPGKFLSALERGALALDAGKLSEGIENLTIAEAEITERKIEAGPLDWLKKGATFLVESLVGVEELEDYKGEGFERVLMLNYKTIGYLLRGERQAYNVTRRAIDWQNFEKSRFEERLRKAQEELKRYEAEQQQQGRDVGSLGVTQMISKQYALNAAKANTVSSAYVNPFGYYVQGLVLEFESYADPSLRDNARISYEKALEINPSASVLKQAIDELKRNAAPRDTKLIHVVVAEGLAPSKKTMVYGLQVRDITIPIKIPIYEPVPSSIGSIEVRSRDGKSHGALSPLADIEAIALRHEKDSEPFQHLRVSLAVVRTVFEKALFQQLGGIGNMLGRARDAMTTPDMRSWLSLPARIHVGRFHVPKTSSAIKLVVYDQSGRPLMSKDVDLGPMHSFVYARSVGENLSVFANRKLWVANF